MNERRAAIYHTPSSVSLAPISPTHRTKALKRGGWSIGKINGKRVYWRGDSKPSYIDEDLLDEVCSS